MKKILVCGFIVSLLCSCSSFKPDYEVIEASETKRPEWIKDVKKVAKEEKEVEKYRFFSGENENVSKKLCETGARADADKKLGAQISQMLKNSYAESVQNEGDNVDTYSEEAVAIDVKTTINGSELVSKYWEKRSYLEELGAEKDRKAYYCYAVSRIDKSRLDKIVDAAIDKFIKAMKGAEADAKQKALEALRDAKEDFVDLKID